MRPCPGLREALAAFGGEHPLVSELPRGGLPWYIVVEGTRITVEFVLEELAHGQSVKALVASHPTLTIDGVQAALDYEVKVLKSDIVYPLEVG